MVQLLFGKKDYIDMKVHQVNYYRIINENHIRLLKFINAFLCVNEK